MQDFGNDRRNESSVHLVSLHWLPDRDFGDLVHLAHYDLQKEARDRDLSLSNAVGWPEIRRMEG